MSSFTVLLISILACLFLNTANATCGIGANRRASGLAGLGPYAGIYGAGPYIAESYGLGAGAAYGGRGAGNVGIAGELPVRGITSVAAQVPIIGAVEYAGCVPAAGVVTIQGSCGCGCGKY